jgi:uncharacterized protein (DUF1800 family)
MSPALRKLALFCTLGACALAGIAELANGKKKDPESPASSMTESARAVHALNRLTFGPRPGDVQKVAAMGVDKWIDLQLAPEKIDNSALDARLARFQSLRLSPRELEEKYPSPFMIKAVQDGRRPMPSDPSTRAMYEEQMARMQQKQAASGDNPMSQPTASPAPSAATAGPVAPYSASADAEATRIAQLPPDQRVDALMKLSPSERQATIQSAKQQKDGNLLSGLDDQQKNALAALAGPQQALLRDLSEAKLVRDIYSERQLEEVMNDFWFNHFNVFAGKGAVRYYAAEYERKVIAPHALGKFEDLLVATAKSPAMLFYLDNWMSEGPASESARGINRTPYRNAGYRRFPGRLPMGMPFPSSGPARYPGQQPAGRGKRAGSGLNENYGRELMELHTLGVNGGYTQKDVTEVARVFTGWTIDRPQQSGAFKFDGQMHEPGMKIILSHKIKDHGEKEGMEVLHILAHHPATAHFVCTKLAMRFVSDNPPPALVDRMSDTFLKKDGDIREVLRTMFHSPEFWAPGAYRAKVKTPLEFVVSAVRATGADVSDAAVLARQLNQFGMPLYMMAPPTGYSMKSDTWVNSSALLGRMNFALALANGRLHGIAVDDAKVCPLPARAPVEGEHATADSHAVLAVLENSLLGGDVSRQTHDTISQQLDNARTARRKLENPAAPPEVGTIAGLILGSPEFQRR